MTADPSAIPANAYRRGDRIGGMHEVVDAFAGGMGVAYVCRRHRETGYFVLKTFHDRFLRHARVREAFQRESVTNVRLGWHPHTVTANTAVILDGRPFIDMLYVPPDAKGRRTLADRLAASAHRPLDIDTTCDFAIDICHGLEHAVGLGVTPHRDLKPGNVLIAEGVSAKVADFGLARAIEADLSAWGASVTPSAPGSAAPVTTKEGARVVGTPPWMSPEHFDGRTDERSDIYALGIMLFEMATGRYPYRSRDWKYAHRHEAVPPLDSPLAAIIQRALAKRPDDRYQTFVELRQDLEHVYEAVTGKPRPALTLVLQQMGLERNALGGWSQRGSVNHFVNLATTLHNLGREEEAESVLRQALQINPANRTAQATLGLVLRRRGAIDESLASLQSVSTKTADPLVCHNIATTLMMAGRHREALPWLDRAIALDDTIPSFVADTASCLEMLGDHHHALAILTQATTRLPRDPLIWLLKAKIAIALEDGTEALQALDKAHPLVATHEVAQLHQQLKQKAQAMRSARRAGDAEPSSGPETAAVTRVEFSFTIPISPDRLRQLRSILTHLVRPTKSITSAELAAAVRSDTPSARPAWADDRMFEQELERLLLADIVWICLECDGVIAFFDVPPGEDRMAFVRDLLLVHNRDGMTCPECPAKKFSVFDPRVLTYGQKVSIGSVVASE